MSLQRSVRSVRSSEVSCCSMAGGVGIRCGTDFDGLTLPGNGILVADVNFLIVEFKASPVFDLSKRASKASKRSRILFP